MYATALSIDLKLDSDLSCVQKMSDGTVRVIASVDAFPRTFQDREFSRSALHAALLQDLSDIVKLDIHVFIPPLVPDASASQSTPPLASLKISSWKTSMNTFAKDASIQFAFSSYWCIVEAYPWRDRVAMGTRIPEAVETSLMNMINGTEDPLITHNNADLILPPVETVIHEYEVTDVYDDVTRVLGGVPQTLLQFYEVIYLCVSHSIGISNATLAVFYRVFSQ